MRLSSTTFLVLILSCAPNDRFLAAQPPQSQPDAEKALSELVQSYRNRPALGVSTTVTLELKQGEIAADSSELTGEFLFGPNRKAVIKLRDMICYVKDGTIFVVHEETADSYFKMEDDGSPYYALMGMFIDMPYPELALSLGEDAIEDIVMQFHPKTPFVQPTAVITEEVDGKEIKRLQLESDFASINVLIDPEKNLMQSAEVTITGSDLVQTGTTLTYRYTYENKVHDVAVDESTFEFDPGDRRRVDVLSALIPRSPVDVGAGPGGLVEKPAPTFKLPTVDGKLVDLEELQGHVVVLDFWATWCGPCLNGLTQLHTVKEWISEEELPATIITINVRERDKDNEQRLERVRRFWEKHGFSLPIALDYTDEVAQAYGVRGIPMSLVIRSDGVVHTQHTGVTNSYADMLKSEIKDALEAVEIEAQTTE